MRKTLSLKIELINEFNKAVAKKYIKIEKKSVKFLTTKIKLLKKEQNKTVFHSNKKSMMLC